MESKVLTARECQEIERKLNMHRARLGVRPSLDESDRLLASYRAAMELLKGTIGHMSSCKFAWLLNNYGEATDDACTCGLAERRAAVAAYEAAAPESAEGQEE